MNLHALKYILSIFLGSMILVCCRSSDSSFATGNMEDITRIELRDENAHTVLTKAGNGQWLVSSFKANMQNIANLKKILSDVEVRCPLPKIRESAYPVKKISDEGILISVFKGKKSVKSYYLLITGEENVEVIGLMEGKHKPYVLELPGMDIDFGDYIVTESAFWENNILFSYNPGQIRHIKIENGEEPDASFSISISDSVSLFDAAGKNVPFDKFKMDAYLSYFSNISFDSNLNVTDDEKRKLTSGKPLYIMTVESDTDSLICYVNPVADSNPDDYGNPLVYNRDFFHLAVPRKNLYARASWLKFDILFEELDYFRK
ncbi:MAG: hypothetical protein LBK96_00975 [Prevotellaceae bacterium]|jgi:hypothetical protein|nr:hypothetical protein [Prevotellaceae bacterium]